MSETIPKVTLYKISEEFERLEALLNTVPDQNALDYFEAQQADLIPLIASKVDGCYEYQRREQDLIGLAKARIKELQDFVKAKENKLANFENYLFFCMNKLKVADLEGQLTKITTKSSTATDIFDSKQIPNEYIKVVSEVHIDKKKILEDLRKGVEVPGAQLGVGKTWLKFDLKRSTKKKEQDNE